MPIFISDRALLRSLLAGVVVFASTSACSGRDRADASRDTDQPPGAVTPADTQTTAAAPNNVDTAITHSDTAARAGAGAPDTAQGVSGYQPMARDTVQNGAGAEAGVSDRSDTVSVGDSARIGKPGERLEGTRASEQANEDTLADQPESDRVRPPEDSSETFGEVQGSTEMARDTSVALGQGDTVIHTDTAGQTAAAGDTATVSVHVDTTTTQARATDRSTTALGTDTSTTAQSPTADTSAIQVSVDTTTANQQTEAITENQAGTVTAAADTAVVVGDSAETGKPGERLEPAVATAEANADSLETDGERVRPPEDSTEVLGNVTTGEDDAERADRRAPTSEEVAAAGIRSPAAVVSANPVAQMTRQGQNCALATDPADLRWDLASSPATLNPCGTGTMTLPRIVTGRE